MPRYVLLAAALWPTVGFAEDLSCVPDTMCIGTMCEAGQDHRRDIVLRDWKGAAPVLHTREGDVTVKRKDKGRKMRWSARNELGQIETLTLRPSDGSFTYVVLLDEAAPDETLTAKGTCTVQP